MSEILDALRAAIKASDQTRYQIAKGAGLDHGAISRLMSEERGLSIEKAEQLAAYLGVEITVKQPVRKKG